jgi:AcrR family transcriptional regulator
MKKKRVRAHGLPVTAPAQPAARRLSLREEQTRFTRERLIDSAVAVFEEFGFRAATIDQIAARAGANRTTFYLHFKGKTDLANAIGARAYPTVAQLVERLTEIDPPTRPALRGWLEDVAAFYEQQRLTVEVANEAIAADPGLATETFAFLGRFVPEEYLERFAPKHRQAALARVILLWLMINQIMFLAIVQRGTPPSPDWKDVLADMCWRMLHRKSPRPS